jgi:hypothetical protein
MIITSLSVRNCLCKNNDISRQKQWQTVQLTIRHSICGKQQKVTKFMKYQIFRKSIQTLNFLPWRAFSSREEEIPDQLYNIRISSWQCEIEEILLVFKSEEYSLQHDDKFLATLLIQGSVKILADTQIQHLKYSFHTSGPQGCVKCYSDYLNNTAITVPHRQIIADH